MLEKIISGGQTGVDRAALDVAIKLNIPHGGWCPKGRKAEDGCLGDCYQLVETESADYRERTKFNIRDADATLIILPVTQKEISNGTLFTINEVKAKNKPYLIIDVSDDQASEKIIDWILKNNIKILNIAGPRESQRPGIYESASKLLSEMLSLLALR